MIDKLKEYIAKKMLPDKMVIINIEVSTGATLILNGDSIKDIVDGASSGERTVAQIAVSRSAKVNASNNSGETNK